MQAIQPRLLWRIWPFNKFELYLDDENRCILFNQKKLSIYYNSSVSIKNGLFFYAVVFSNAEDKVKVFNGLSKESAYIIYEYIKKTAQYKTQKELDNIRLKTNLLLEKLDSVKKLVMDFLGTDKYITKRESDDFIGSINYKNLFNSFKDIKKHPFFIKIENHKALTEVYNSLNAIFKDFNSSINKRNDNFVEEEIKRYDKLFNSVESNPLTKEQSVAAVIMEENNLLVAAAGSGKTSVIIGKTAYVLQKGLFKPDEIICIAFNKKAAKEMEERLASKNTIVKDIDKIETRTFHSFGYSVIRQLDKQAGIDESESIAYINKAIESLLESDSTFAANYFLLKSTIYTENPAVNDFSNKEEYKKYLNFIYKNRYQNKGIKTLSGHFVRSFEEVSIANWLYLHCVDFEYEKQWDEAMNELGWDDYRPDFYYPKVNVYHEHFALNKKGRAPSFMSLSDREGYEIQAKEKIKVMEKINSKNFYTTSADYFDGTLFKKLDNKIKLIGLSPKLRDIDEIKERIKDIGKNWVDILIQRGISLVKSNSYSKGDLLARISNQKDKMRAHLFINVLMTLIEKYNKILVDEGKIDYADMIRLAGKYLADGIVKMPYKFILIDEFQDVTQGEAKMIKAALNQYKESILFGVGDDWQAINGFAGSDINIFNGFKTYFGYTKEVYLTKTFRSNQGISNISSSFVKKDSFLKNKKVKSFNKNLSEVIDIKTYKKESDIKEAIEESLKTLLSLNKSGKIPSVFILSRYKINNTLGLSAENIDFIKNEFAGKCHIEFSTVHGAKGRESDYVIVLGLFNETVNWRCFPGILEADPLFDLLMPQYNSNIERPEERRLFYVALTRAKEKVVLLSQEGGYSEYVLNVLGLPKNNEITFNESTEIPKVCPKCRTGLLVERQNGKTGHKFLGCSNYPECRKTMPLVNIFEKSSLEIMI
jgi:DNA helicase-4